MTAAIYYDQLMVEAADVERATGLVPGGRVLHVRMADSEWSPGAAVPSTTVPPPRDYDFRLRLMLRLDELHERLPRVIHGGIDLVEVARYEWLFAMEGAFHRAGVASEILRSQRPDTLLWYGGHEGEAARLAPACARAGTRLVAHPARAAGARRREWTATIKDEAWSWLVGLRSWRASRPGALARRARESARARRIVFAEYYPNSAKLAAAVARRLEEDGADVLFLCGRPEVQAALQDKARAAALVDELAGGQALAASARWAFDRVGFERAIRALPDDLLRLGDGPVFRELLGWTLARTSGYLFHSAARYVLQARRVLAALRPAVVVTTTFASCYGRAWSMVAEAMGIPSVYLQHGVLGEGKFFSYLPNTRLLVWGECNRRSLLREGLAPERVRVIGAASQHGLAEWRRRLASAPIPEPSRARPRVLFLGSRAGGTVVNTVVFERTLDAVARHALAIPGAELTVKLHPGDATGIAQKLLTGRERITVVQQANLFELLCGCDVAIVTSSTSGMEACALDRPLVSFNITGMPDIVSYGRYGAALLVYREEALAGALDDALWNLEARARLAEGRRRMMEDMLDGATGNPNEKAAHEIAKFLR